MVAICDLPLSKGVTHMVYMVAAYLVIWAASFAFIFSIMRRQSGLQREIETLKDALREKR
jgi:CcmD family protein